MNTDTSLVYLNGKFLPLQQACVSVMDRGFLFGDGVYELIPVYGGRLFRARQHLERLTNSLAKTRMANPLNHEQWHTVLNELIAHQANPDQYVYLQVTRGFAPTRNHAFPGTVTPTVFAMATPAIPPEPYWTEHGVSAITLDDTRWHHCDIKAVALLPTERSQIKVYLNDEDAALVREMSGLVDSDQNWEVLNDPSIARKN